jgi:hypothetical protein
MITTLSLLRPSNPLELTRNMIQGVTNVVVHRLLLAYDRDSYYMPKAIDEIQRLLLLDVYQKDYLKMSASGCAEAGLVTGAKLRW